MALMNDSRQWNSIRIAVKELLCPENLLLRAKKRCDAANDRWTQTKVDLESIENKLNRYTRKQASRSGRKQKKYIKLVTDFEARHLVASANDNRASERADNQSRKVNRALGRRNRRQEQVESMIKRFHPTRYVSVMDAADIISINMIRDERKELHFVMGRSVTDANKVSIERSAREIGIPSLSSLTLVHLDGANFTVLTVERSEALGYRMLV